MYVCMCVRTYVRTHVCVCVCVCVCILTTSGTFNDPELEGKLGFKIGEHLNGSAAAKPFSYDVLRRISFLSILIQYVLYFTSRIYEVGLEAQQQTGYKYEAYPKQFASLKLVA